MARHTLRIARQGISLLQTAGFNVKVEDPQEYFDLTKRPKDEMLAVIAKELHTLETTDSILYEKPDRQAVSNYLREIRFDHP